MSRVFQLVALVLVLMMGATPMLAALPCPDLDMAAGCCGPDCPMKAGKSTASHASQTMGPAVHSMPAAQLCCQSGAAHAVEFVEPQTGTAPAVILAQASGDRMQIVPAAVSVKLQARLPMPDLAPSPANLCTFLI